MTYNSLVLSTAILVWFCFLGIGNHVHLDPLKKLKHYPTVPQDSLILLAEIGLVYYHEIPFTGSAISYFEHGDPSIRIEYVEGKKHGFYRKWFHDGQISFQSLYTNGKKNGSTKSWWKNGNIRSASTFEKGVAHGVQVQWYKSGAKFKQRNLHFGKEQGLQKSWRENGKLYNNYEAKNGRIFGLKRSTLCYELENEIIS